MNSLASANTAGEKLTENKSPSSSPRSSPRPSPQPQSRLEHPKHEGSPSSLESSTSRLSSSPGEWTVNSTQDSLNSKDAKVRTKKKSSWLNTFYPTYKSRSEDFKKLFSDVPPEERLVVDYSCALQKEILVQGRLYISQNYLCFYANIFGWETNLTLKWKDVAAITKEKTALVIPNAVLIFANGEKYFFTSLVQRDKAYLMLFRLWQNALMDQPMSQKDMWSWVHLCYGAELGLTSDDEDYISPTQEDDKLSRLSIDSFSEIDTNSQINFVMDQLIERVEDSKSGHSTDVAEQPQQSDSESDQPLSMKGCDSTLPDCTATHEGRILLDEIYSIHIDQLFTLLFTSSKFFLDFHASRKTSDLTQSPWTHDPTDNRKSRVVNLTMSLGQTMGPKSCQVTERQTMLPCSKSGSLYCVDVETVNGGVPYADSFYVTVHYCLKKVSDTHSSINVTGQLKYKKSVWGLVKSMIERNVWSGLDDFFTKLKEALHTESEENVPEQRRKSRRKRRLQSIPRYSLEDIRLNVVNSRKKISNGFFTTEICTMIVLVVLIALLFLNGVLYYKLWHMEDTPNNVRLIDLSGWKNSPKTHEDWITLLQQQETMRIVEAQKWESTLRDVVRLLKLAEESLGKLQLSIQDRDNGIKGSDEL